MQCSDGAAVQFTPNCPLSDSLSDFMEGPLLITFHPANGRVKPQIRPEPNECGARGVRRVEHVDVDRQVKGASSIRSRIRPTTPSIPTCSSSLACRAGSLLPAGFLCAIRRTRQGWSIPPWSFPRRR